MAEETSSTDQEQAAPGVERGRDRSTIQFPYGDLDDAVEVAKAVYRNAGEQCSLDQLAAWMGHGSVQGGAFRLKVSTARIFGIADMSRKRVALTPLGRQMVDPQHERGARVEAFLHVPLYRALYDKYLGHLLPPDVGLEREMVNLGVAEKQKRKARQAFQRSADLSGFFDQGRDRLVVPAGLPTVEIPEPEEKTKKQDRGGNDGSGTDGGDLHPFIQGLLQTLPPAGTRWSESQQQQWLDTAKNIFGLIYETTATE